MTALLERLKVILGEEAVKAEEPMKKHTTFRIGGPAELFVKPGSAEELAEVVSICRKEKQPFYLLGNGSNLLVSDEGYRGVMISTERLNRVEASEGPEESVLLTGEAGVLLSRFARTALDYELTGFEFAAGIPGTLGGAMVMNAGAYGSEMKNVVVSADVLTPEGERRTLTCSELQMGYRTSVIAKEGHILLSATVCLKKGDGAAIKARMEELALMRKTKQPLEYPSAGSTFKRPEGYFAGKLIDEAGLRGFSVGGAQVSEKHCGFVINKGGATAADVLALCREVHERVKEQFGVELEMEVKRL